MKLNTKLMKPITRDLAWINPTYIGDIDFQNIIRSGNVVEVGIRALIIENIPNNTTIFTFPYKVAKGITEMAGIGGRYDIETIKWVYTNTANELRVGYGFSNVKNKYIHIHFTYITSD